MSEAKREDETKETKTELKDFDSIEVNSPEELQELLDRLGGSGDNGSGKKIRKIGIVNRLFPNPLINLLFYIVFITILTVAIQGYLKIFNYDYFYKLFIFAIGFAVIDTLGRDVLYSKIPFVVITSFGSVILILTILSALGMIFLIPEFEVKSYGLFVLYLAIILIFRLIITSYLSKKLHPYFRKKMLKKKVK